MWAEDKVFERNASSVDFVLEVSRVGLIFSAIEKLFPSSKKTIFRKLALLTMKSPHSICLASGLLLR